MFLFPTGRQWKQWSLPSKLGCISAYVGFLSLLLSVIPFLLHRDSQSTNSTPSVQAFRILYFSLGGHALDFIARGELDKKWEANVGGQPFIVPTAPYRLLQSLTERFKTKFFGAYLTSDPNNQDLDEESAKRLQGQDVFAGGEVGAGFDAQPLPSDLQEIVSAEESWNTQSIVRSSSPIDPVDPGTHSLASAEDFYFWRLFRKSDFGRFGDSVQKDFVAFISKGVLPPDFGIVSLRYDGCSRQDLMILSERHPRLLVAVLENVSPMPIRVGAFTLREAPATGLRLLADDVNKLNSLPSQSKTLFPLGILQPREKILIPMSLTMEFGDFELHELSGVNSEATGTAQLNDTFDLPIYLPNRPAPLIITRPETSQYFRRAKPVVDLSNKYVFGDSLKLDSVRIDGTEFQLRTFDPKALVIKSGTNVGSCPYAFTYSQRAHKWLSMGHILYGVNDKSKETTDITALTDFDGRIRIQEKDPEKSFIDSMYVDMKCRDRTITLKPKLRLLQSNDHDYLELTQGDEIQVNFDGMVPTGCRATLRTTGYYQPF